MKTKQSNRYWSTWALCVALVVCFWAAVLLSGCGAVYGLGRDITAWSQGYTTTGEMQQAVRDAEQQKQAEARAGYATRH